MGSGGKEITSQTPAPPLATQMDTWGVQSEVGAGKDKRDSLPATRVHAHAHAHTHTRLCPDLPLLLHISLEYREQKTFS